MRDAVAVAVDTPRSGSLLGRRRGSASVAGFVISLRSRSAAGSEAALVVRAETRSSWSATTAHTHGRADAPKEVEGDNETTRAQSVTAGQAKSRPGMILDPLHMTNTQPKSNQKSQSGKTWRTIVLESLVPLAVSEPTQWRLTDLYAEVEKHPEARERMSSNHNVRPKVRQVLNGLRSDGVIGWVGRGLYELPPDLTVND